VLRDRSEYHAALPVIVRIEHVVRFRLVRPLTVSKFAVVVLIYALVVYRVARVRWECLE
jgi:hypothetical protein